VKSDIDRLMANQGLDAIVVMGPSTDNYPLRYMLNFAHISDGIVVQKRGEPPTLVCNSMEREEGAKSGLPTETYHDYRMIDLISEGGSWAEGQLLMLAEILKRRGVTGKLAFYGRATPDSGYQLISRIAGLVPGVEVASDMGRSVIDEACMTKDSAEIAGLKDVAARTNLVMGEVVEFIKSHKASNGVLVKNDGSPLTVRDVKRFLRGCLYEHDLENDGEPIFAIGRDAGVPHSHGEPGDPLLLGKSIIFDLFPRALDTGYLHDMTRTFCLGFAPPEVKEAYDQVARIFFDVAETLSPGILCARLQDRVCDFFKEQGHDTIRDNVQAKDGYVHGLGHGVGFEIHEGPGMYSYSKDILQPSQVITIEPGLYYPDRGFGVRIEDTFLIDEKGEAHSLTPFPKDLVIPVSGS
jgi:Xaa-Pro aminopeptidase